MAGTSWCYPVWLIGLKASYRWYCPSILCMSEVYAVIDIACKLSKAIWCSCWWCSMDSVYVWRPNCLSSVLISVSRLFIPDEDIIIQPAPVAQWLACRTVGRKVWGSNPIRVMWDFSALAGSYPELGVLWAQWEGWNHTAELHPLNGCVFEGVVLITWPTLQVPQFPGLVNTGIIVTVSVVCGPVK